MIVAATQATVRSRMYERAFHEKGIDIEMIALPELARAIEDAVDQKTLAHIIEPAVKRAIALNASDPSEAVVDAAMREFNTDGNGTSQFFVSKKSDVFDQTVRRLFGQDIEIKVIDVDKAVQEQWTKHPFQACTSLSEC